MNLVKFLKTNTINRDYKVYVGNIDENATEEELTNFFSNKLKSLIYCKIIYENNKNKSKGYGFLHISDKTEFDQLLSNEEDIYFHNKKLTIK